MLDGEKGKNICVRSSFGEGERECWTEKYARIVACGYPFQTGRGKRDREICENMCLWLHFVGFEGCLRRNRRRFLVLRCVIPWGLFC